MDYKPGRNNLNSLPLRKSRKIRECRLCHEPIKPGEFYAPNRRRTWDMCEKCWKGE